MIDADAFDVDVLRLHPETVGQRGQDADLVQRIVTVDVQRRLGLGIALGLRVLEHLVEIRPLLLHPGEDVIAGAIDDAVELRDAVADKPFAQRFDDGDAAAHAGLVIEVGPVLPGRGEQFLAVRGEQGLVGGDDRLAQLERGQDHRARQRRAAHQFRDDVHLRVVHHGPPVGRQARDAESRRAAARRRP